MFALPGRSDVKMRRDPDGRRSVLLPWLNREIPGFVFAHHAGFDIGVDTGVEAIFDRGIGFRAVSELFLGAAFFFHATLFLPLHFLLAFLKGCSRCHKASLGIGWVWSMPHRQRERWVLPARLARLARRFAIILVGEASAPAASATTAGVAAAAFWPAAFFPGARFVYLQVAPANLFAVETGDGFGGFGVIGHFHESKAAGPAGLAVGGNVNACDLAERLEERTQVALGGLETHVANKQILHSLSLLKSVRGRWRSAAALAGFKIALR